MGLRVSFKYQGNNMTQARHARLACQGGTTRSCRFRKRAREAVTVNYNINATDVPRRHLRARFGNQLAGCGGLPVNDVSDARTTGLANLPLLFPDANVINPDYYAYEILQSQNPPYWDGTRLFKVPAFSWGNRVVAATGGGNTAMGAPPSVVYPGFININTHAGRRDQPDEGHRPPHVQDRVLQQPQPEAGKQRPGRNATSGRSTSSRTPSASIRSTRRSASRTLRSGASATSCRPPSTHVEGTFNYDNREAYVQDNWKVKSNWSIDYGVRFVHAVPQHDALLQSGNFLPDQWALSAAPMLLVPGLRGQHRDLHRRQPVGEEPGYGRACSARTRGSPSARSCRTRARSGTVSSSRGRRSPIRRTSSRS